MELRPDHQFGPDAAAFDDVGLDIGSIDFNDPASFFKVIGAGPGTSIPIPKFMSPTDVRCEAEKKVKEYLYKLY